MILQNYSFLPIVDNFEKFCEELLTKHKKLAILIDKKVLPFLSLTPTHNILIVPFEATEDNKTRESCYLIQDLFLDFDLKRSDAIIAIGGGITTDLGGYIASTILRGVDCYFIPTTLLAMVDAAFGGKTAVNTKHGKNLIGTFYDPKFIFLDCAFLKTLPQKEILNGLSEMIKYGIMLDSWLLDQLFKNPLDPKLIDHCIKLKLKIVKKDQLDKGVRQVLNFGHTIAHGLEKASQYKIPHGLAVFHGMKIECSLVDQLKCHLKTLEAFEKGFFYPKIDNQSIDMQILATSLLKDKKSITSKVPIVKDALGAILELEIEKVISQIKSYL
jgi:3-dehydroquinate synthase